MEGSTPQIGVMTPMQRHVLATLATIVLLLVTSGLVAGRAQAQDTDPDDFVDGEVVVKLNKTSGTTLKDVYGAYPRAVDRTRTKTFLASSNIYLLRLQEGRNTTDVATRMADDTARFLYAELNYTTDAPEGSRPMKARPDNEPTPSDPDSYSRQYAAGALNLPETRDVSKGAGATVAVLDTGMQPDHPELAESLVPGYDFVGDDGDPSEEPNGLDDDGDCPTTPCTDPSYIDETTGHGTHVAGIVHLAAPEAKIMPMRVLDSDGTGNIFVIAEAVQRAVVGPDREPNTGDEADVINMSLSTSRESNLIQDISDDLAADDDDDDDGEDDGDDDDGPALRGVSTNGVVVVGAAGNDGGEQRAYPAAEGGVIGVASVGEDETKSEFSNYYAGPEVDISAPGDDIHSTFTNNGYAEWDGTSMATPFVAGQAALIRSVKPNMPPTASPGEPSVTGFITSTARSIDEKNPDYSGKLGAGHADAYASLLKATANPTVSDVRPMGRIKDRTPRLAATVADRLTDLTSSNVTFSLDGRTIKNFSYNADTDRLTYATGRLFYGYHKAKVAATDDEGFDGARTWRFRVVR